MEQGAHRRMCGNRGFIRARQFGCDLPRSVKIEHQKRTGGQAVDHLEERVGAVSVDVTGVAEEVASMESGPIQDLLEQGAVALLNANAVNRTQEESVLLMNILE